MKRIFVSGRRRETRLASSRPVHPGHDNIGEQQVDDAFVMRGHLQRGGAILGFENRVALSLQGFER